MTNNANYSMEYGFNHGWVLNTDTGKKEQMKKEDYKMVMAKQVEQNKLIQALQNKKEMKEAGDMRKRLDGVVRRNVESSSLEVLFTTDETPSINSVFKSSKLMGFNAKQFAKVFGTQQWAIQEFEELKAAALHGGIVIGVEENLYDATSPNYHWALDSAGQQHRQLGRFIENYKIQVVEDSIEGLVSKEKEVDAYVLPHIYSLEISGLIPGLLKNPVTNELTNELGRSILDYIRYAITFEEASSGMDFVKPYNFLEFAYGSVSQLRKGDNDAVVTASIDANQPTITTLAMLAQTGVTFDSFAKKVGDDKVKFPMNKIFTRFKLANSSGIELGLFDNVGKAVVTERVFKFHEKDGDSYKQVDVVGQHYAYENGRTILVLPEDFTVIKSHLIEAPVFNENKEMELVSDYEVVIDAPKTDGISYMDESVAREIYQEMNGKKGMQAAVQFRMTPYSKGLMLAVPGLTKRLDADIILFAGAVKASIHHFLEEGDIFFSALNVNRKVEENMVGRLSRQGYLNLFNNAEAAKAAIEENAAVWEKVSDLDPEYVKAVFNVNDDMELEELLANASADDLTRQLVKANPVAALKSGATREKVQSYLKGTYAKVASGQFLYMRDTAYAYLTVDPLLVVDYLVEGLLSVVYEEGMEAGIKVDGIVLPRKVNGQLVPAYGEAGCIRFPMLHTKESRKVMADGTVSGFYQTAGGHSKGGYASRYREAVKRGFFEGCVVFSLWDMNPEAMSGADFDGDFAIITLAEKVVKHMKQQPLFLDYSILKDASGKETLVAGCPFGQTIDGGLPEGLLTEREERFAKETLEMTINGFDVVFNKEKYNQYGKGASLVLDKICRFFLMTSLTGNDIGTLTNILASVTEAKQEAEATVTSAELLDLEVEKEYFGKEVSGYGKLEHYMAMAIRWEIDKAKHGGAYREFMPFIDKALFETGSSAEALEDLEEEFGISLQRLFVNRLGVEA